MKSVTHEHTEAAITGWVTPAWAAALLNRKQRTIRAWARDGDLPIKTHPQLGLMVDMASCTRLDATRPRQQRRATRR